MTDKKAQKKVTEKDLKKSYWIWTLFNSSAFSMERMQAPMFAYMMSPIIKRLYGDNPEEIKNALVRHMVLFNTEPQIGIVANGVTIALEEQRANGAPISDETINAVKTGIMGPMAGIGDSLNGATLVPILLAIGMSMSQDTGSVLGPIFYILSYLTIILLLSYYLFKFGYKYGMEATQQLAEGGFKRITSSFAVLGLIVAGGIGASITALSTPLGYSAGEMAISVQAMLDGIFPRLLPFLLTLWLWWGMRHRGWAITRILLAVFLVTLVGYLPGFLGNIFDISWLSALRIF